MENNEVNILPSTIKDKQVLIAALDWGMGHTTRCIALIQQLLKGNNKVIFAGNEQQCSFVKGEFDQVEITLLSGYNIRLDSKKHTYFQLIKQLSKINSAIKCEKKWLNNFVKDNSIDLIISDNRYGFFHKKITSILLTHQLNLQLPIFKKIINKKLQQKIEKFNCCWIPDSENRRLTGELTNRNLKIQTNFIGPLCRFKKIELDPIYDYLIILSGPEPERSNFLNKTTHHVKENKLNAVFIGEKLNEFKSFKNPDTKELNKLIAQSKIIVSRAGYTTIMEMTCIGKNAILIPTKGQYEQEYLAKTIKLRYIDFKEKLS